MVLAVNTLTTFIDASRAAKVTLAAVIGVWIGHAAAAAEAGWLPIFRAKISVCRLRQRQRQHVLDQEADTRA